MASRWEDPDSAEEEDVEGTAQGGEDHPQTDQGLGDQGSDDSAAASTGGSDAGAAEDQELELLLKKASGRGGAAQPQGAKRPAAAAAPGGGGEGGLWDPLEGLTRRKRGRATTSTKEGGGLGVAQAGTAQHGPATPAVGSTVCLLGLKKAQEMNGQVGVVATPADPTTRRCQVLINGQLRSLRGENMREVHTGAVVRLSGLQSAVELNGRLAECGRLDVASGRYSIRLPDGTTRKVKAENVELARRYVTAGQMLSKQRCPFSWKSEVLGALGKAGNATRSWEGKLRLLGDLGLPAPRLVPASALADCRPSTWRSLVDAAILAKSAPIDPGSGELTCRLLAVSCERDACCPAESGAAWGALAHLPDAAEALARCSSKPVFLLLPGHCVLSLPCLQEAATCAWPVYLSLCQALLCLEEQNAAYKAWYRADQVIMGAALQRPVYIFDPKKPRRGNGGQPGPVADASDGGWLLSDAALEVQVAPPSDGQILPAERPLLEKICSELLPGGVHGRAALTCYEL